jgi:hypothetical protein
MSKRMRFLKLLFLGVILSACSHSQSRLSFTPLTMLFRTDTSGEGSRRYITRIEEFLVDNYSDNKEAEKQIDSFAFSHVTSDIRKYATYQMIFYKKTSRTTVEAIKDYKNWIPPESLDDMIYDYWWNNGKFTARYKIINGKIVDPPGDIKVTPILPDSTSKN